MVDSQFIESRNFQLRDIARAFDVPPYKLAIEGETEGPAMVQIGQQYLNGPISGYCERWKAKAEQFYELDGDDTFLDWGYGHFLKADLLSRFTAYRQAVGGPWMKVNEARRAEGLSSVLDGDTVQQAVNMAPLGWVPSASGGASDQGSNQTGVPGEGGNGDPNRNPADDPGRAYEPGLQQPRTILSRTQRANWTVGWHETRGARCDAAAGLMGTRQPISRASRGQGIPAAFR